MYPIRLSKQQRELLAFFDGDKDGWKYLGWKVNSLSDDVKIEDDGKSLSKNSSRETCLWNATGAVGDHFGNYLQWTVDPSSSTQERVVGFSLNAGTCKCSELLVRRLPIGRHHSCGCAGCWFAVVLPRHSTLVQSGKAAPWCPLSCSQGSAEADSAPVHWVPPTHTHNTLVPAISSSSASPLSFLLPTCGIFISSQRRSTWSCPLSQAAIAWQCTLHLELGRASIFEMHRTLSRPWVSEKSRETYKAKNCLPCPLVWLW